jgi:hypothetical protein
LPEAKAGSKKDAEIHVRKIKKEQLFKNYNQK